jgi:cytochrome c-type biogenesis protein CcmH/NrfG
MLATLRAMLVALRVMRGLDPSIGSRTHDRKMARRRPIRAESDPRVEPFNMHTSSRGAFEGQKVKGFNTEKQARITESTEQKRIWALRAMGGRAHRVIILISVHSVILACFSVLKTCFLDATRMWTQANIPRARPINGQTAAGEKPLHAKPSL